MLLASLHKTEYIMSFVQADWDMLCERSVQTLFSDPQVKPDY